MSQERFMSEFKNIERELPLFSTVSGNLKHYRGWIYGPKNSPYQDYFFHIEINLPDDYPFEPPQVRFLTKIWHPNVNSKTGEICNDILKITGEGEMSWSPGSDIVSVIMNIIGMLGGNFNFKSPLNTEAAKQSSKSFDKTARVWTKKYASNTPEI